MAPNQSLSGTVKKQRKIEKPKNTKNRIRALSSKPIVTVRLTLTRIAPKMKTQNTPSQISFRVQIETPLFSLYKTPFHT
jgi:hypothetical protein